MSAKIQLLNFACIFGIRCCSLQFVPTSASEHWDVTKRTNGEWGTGNGEWEMENEK